MTLVAFITGINGQDGSYLAELLLEKNYIVYGIYRRSSVQNTKRIYHLLKHPNLFIKHGDLLDSFGLYETLIEIRSKYFSPHTISENSRLEVYNLAAMSHVQVSFELPEYTSDVDAIGTVRLLNAITSSDMVKHTRFYQASTSELYGLVQEVPQKETTPFYPRSPYAVSKLYAHWITKNYRESYGMFASCGILFNHESPRRGETFVTRKITKGLADIVNGKTDRLVLGNLDAKRDWGFAGDYVEGMWRILQHNIPDDFILSTNEYHSVREFVEKSFALRGFHIVWKGEGLDEIGYDSKTGRELIFVSDKFYRPAEVEELLGDSTKARTILGWNPTTTFDELIKMMVDHDCERSEPHTK